MHRRQAFDRWRSRPDGGRHGDGGWRHVHHGRGRPWHWHRRRRLFLLTLPANEVGAQESRRPTPSEPHASAALLIFQAGTEPKLVLILPSIQILTVDVLIGGPTALFHRWCSRWTPRTSSMS